MKRFDLIPSTDGLAEVFGQGVEEGHELQGWRSKGVNYLINHLKIKLNDFENLHNTDVDGISNIDKVAAYALMIKDVITNAHHCDDRIAYRKGILPRIALDVDEVVADFIGTYKKKYNENISPYWQCDYDMSNNLKEIMEDEEYWINLPVLHYPNFEPACYVSSRSIPVDFTKKFIQKAGLPCAPIFHVPWNTSKVDILKEQKIDILIDDKPENFQQAEEAGIFCYLMDAPHNQHFNVHESKRIYNLNLKF